jgi:dolichyl-phosphate beta-glucosyltransferase
MLLHMSSIAIIIPCFNEAERLNKAGFRDFLSLYPTRTLVFVNDGSTDATAAWIEDFNKELPQQVVAVHNTANKGKASAIAKGIEHCLQKAPGTYDLIGYLDADLSVSLEEMQRICTIVEEQQLDYGFGSRIKKLNATIDRSAFRHLTGRIIATIIDSRFQLGIYDTQCGAKVFRTALASSITDKLFLTRWLFDIEIFLRIRMATPAAKGAEIPLLAWSSKKGSKLGVFQAGAIGREIIRLFYNYPAR